MADVHFRACLFPPNVMLFARFFVVSTLCETIYPILKVSSRIVFQIPSKMDANYIPFFKCKKLPDRAKIDFRKMVGQKKSCNHGPNCPNPRRIFMKILCVCLFKTLFRKVCTPFSLLKQTFKRNPLGFEDFRYYFNEQWLGFSPNFLYVEKFALIKK